MSDTTTIRVRAKHDGFANGNRIKAGTTFSIDEKLFSMRWMERVDASEPDELEHKRAAAGTTHPSAPSKPRSSADLTKPKPKPTSMPSTVKPAEAKPTGARNPLGD